MLFQTTQAAGAAEPPQRAPEMTWFWTALLGTGHAFATAILGVHLAVGYTSVLHLLPAIAG